ncbi:MAG: hypothetical protein KJN90_13340, partial [Gammaproteobacteria bacterium]|nr:hypothetical protein [Gammaproteobacteria bacterium]
LQQLGDGGGVDSGQAVLNFVFGNRSGPAGRPVSMISFLLDGQDWPAPAGRFKYNNLMIHLLCGLLIGWLSLLLFQSIKVRDSAAQILALFVAALWLLHPLNVSTTLYVVQRMTQLMTLFSLAALVFYVKGRLVIQHQPGKGLLMMSLSLCPFGLLAVLSKENGALLLVAIAALEVTVFANSVRSKMHRLWLAGGVLVPLLVVVGYLTINFGRLTANYQFRAFSLVERLLTESRIIIDYLFNVFVPVTGNFGLYRDDVVVSQGLFDPITTLLSCLTVAVLLAVATWRRSKQPMFSFAVFWFFGWHLLESTFLPLELYFEHRNYIAMFGPLLATVFYINWFVENHGSQLLKRAAQVAAGLLLVLITVLTLQLTSLWGNSFALQAHWAERHPTSYRAQAEYAFLLAGFGEPAEGYQRIAAIQQYYPDEIALQLQRWNFACSNGFTAPFALDEIASDLAQEYYKADLTGELGIFLENLIAGRCEYPAQQQILALMNRLSEVPMRNFERSGFHLLYSDLYVHYRQLNPALIELRNAFEVRPDAQYPIRQAIISASAGNYQDSLIFLQRAREADGNRRSFVESRIDEIEAMEQDLKARLDSN